MWDTSVRGEPYPCRNLNPRSSTGFVPEHPALVPSRATLFPLETSRSGDQAAATWQLSKISSCLASLHLLSEASGLEGEGEDERAVTPPTAPPRRHRVSAKLNADVIVLQGGENSSEYEDISSGDEIDGAAIADDDLGCGGDEFDQKGDELSESDAVELDQAFLVSMRVGNTSLSRAALDERENTLREMEWTAPSAEFETDSTPATQAYGAHDILHVVGLLVARMLIPRKRRLAAHWSVVEDGAIPAARLGRCMSRDRFNNILRDLHFVDNTVDHGHDKPRQAVEAASFYAGKRDGGDNGIDFKSGAAAVVRNLSAAFTPESGHNWHAVVVDRFYSSGLLAVELLKTNVYVVGRSRPTAWDSTRPSRLSTRRVQQVSPVARSSSHAQPRSPP
ncbi:unnamed protein product [Phytophthora fragariaefolia]|uniref:Unnamed protein product n=1 Tax=Phytophthora fragariaefolia TaxID=1490495 RepID=A0A9W6XG79_9STRA|nr:unnamed protein product [Phytophthora fragariaefolia]